MDILKLSLLILTLIFATSFLIFSIQYSVTMSSNNSGMIVNTQPNFYFYAPFSPFYFTHTFRYPYSYDKYRTKESTTYIRKLPNPKPQKRF